jgi:hypothetical protein
VAANGLTIQLYFRRILQAAFPNVSTYNEFVREAAVPRPSLEGLGLDFEDGDVRNENRLGDILTKIANEFFQRPDVLQLWVDALSSRYLRQSVVQEALDRFRQEQAKPPLWAITDENDSDQFVFDDPFLRKALSFELKSRYRLDSFEPLLSGRAAQDLDQDKRDFEQAKCIVISRSAGNDSPAQDLINNITDLALAAYEGGKKGPRIIFTAGTREQALALQAFVTDKWTPTNPGEPPYLFLIPSDDQKEIAQQRAKAKAFLTIVEEGEDKGPLQDKGSKRSDKEVKGERRLSEKNGAKEKAGEEGKVEKLLREEGGSKEKEAKEEDLISREDKPKSDEIAVPSSPTENDLVILVGGSLTNEDDAACFIQLVRLLGGSDRLLIVQPWCDGNELEWNRELERKLGVAERPLLIEYVGKNHEAGTDVFFKYLLQSAMSRSGGIDIMARLQTILTSAYRQRMIWNPSGMQLNAPAGVEIVLDSPVALAPLIRRYLGLAEDAVPLNAFVAVEEVIVDRKLDTPLRRALKKHLSIVAGGTGEPPSTDSVVPFLFRVTPDKDPLHLAVENFLPSGPNIIAACDVSRGNRPLKQYLTEINARIRDGVNSYFKDKKAAPDYLRIVVMVADPDPRRLDTEFKDNADGSWQVIKFNRKAEGYEPDMNDIELATAWVNAARNNPQGHA